MKRRSLLLLAACLTALCGIVVLGASSVDEGRSASQSTEPCVHLPNPPGNATGIEERCFPAGSSSGVARADFNNDGYGDLAIGAPYEDLSSVTDSGAVFVIYGSPTGLLAPATSGATPAAQVWTEDSQNVPGAAEANDHFGSALAAGDFNNDGITDLAIGIPGEDNGVGAVVILYGSTQGLSANSIEPSLILPSSLGEISLGVENFLNYRFLPSEFGRALTWGDFDNDGNKDLVIAAPASRFIPLLGAWGQAPLYRERAGFVVVIYGNRSRMTGSNTKSFLGQHDFRPGAINTETIDDQDQFGATLGAGDFNGDGFSDLVVGVPYEDLDGIENAGLIHIFSGCTQLLALCGRSQITQGTAGVTGGVEAGDAFGWSVAAGDFNGDGRDDLAVGVPYEDSTAGANSGVVHVFHGSTTGITTTGNQLWFQSLIFGANVDPFSGSPSEGDDLFGYSLAASDFNGDGRDDLAIGVPFEDVLVDRGTHFESVADAGEVNVIYGSAAGLTTTGRRNFHQSVINVEDDAEANDQFGFTVSAWNFGGGATADLAIGVPREDLNGITNCGAVAVLYGGSSGLTTAGDQLWHQDVANVPSSCETGDQFGRALY